MGLVRGELRSGDGRLKAGGEEVRHLVGLLLGGGLGGCARTQGEEAHRAERHQKRRDADAAEQLLGNGAQRGGGFRGREKAVALRPACPRRTGESMQRNPSSELPRAGRSRRLSQRAPSLRPAW